MTDDTRTTCTRCHHFKAGRCMNARTAQLGVWASIEIGQTLANLPQHCPGYKERKE